VGSKAVVVAARVEAGCLCVSEAGKGIGVSFVDGGALHFDSNFCLMWNGMRECGAACIAGEL
jgi:hypothetical protein